MLITPAPLYLSLPALSVSLAFSIGDDIEGKWIEIWSQAFLFTCLTLLFASLLLNFFIKYDKLTLATKEEGEDVQSASLFSNLVSTILFLILPLTLTYMTNTLLGPLRTVSLLLCLFISSNGGLSISKSGSSFVRYQGIYLILVGLLLDLLILRNKTNEQTLLGYGFLLTAYSILFNPFNNVKLERSVNRAPDFRIIITLSIASVVLFVSTSSQTYNLKLFLIGIVSLLVALMSSINIEKLHRSKTKSLGSFIDTKLKENYIIKYLVFNVILMFVYFLNIGLVSEVDSLTDVIWNFLRTHWFIIISNLSFIFMIVRGDIEDEEDENLADASKDNSAITVFSLLVYLFHAEESKSIFNFLLLNIAFMFIQLLYSFRSKSLSLLSDSLHMLLDCTSLFLGLMASVIAKKNKENPTTKFAFGLSRIETLAGFTNGSLLLGIVFGILNESVQRIFSPVSLKNTTELLIVSFMGLIVNLVGIFAFNHGDSHGHGHSHGHSHSHAISIPKEKNIEKPADTEHHHDEKDHKTSEQEHEHEHDTHEETSVNFQNEKHNHEHSHNICSHSEHVHDEAPHEEEETLNDNMHGIFLHILADTLGSVGVIMSTIIVKITGWALVDPITSILIALLILVSSIPLLKSSSSNLLLSVPSKSEKELQYVLGEVLKISGVKSYTTPRFWPQEGSSTKLVGYLHIQFFRTETSLGIRQKAEKLFKNSRYIDKVYLQVENEMDDCWCRRDGVFGTN